jgi:hypothetical protein
MRAERRFIERGLGDRFGFDKRGSYGERQPSVKEDDAGNNMG